MSNFNLYGDQEIDLETSWKQQLEGEFTQDYMLSLRHFLRQQRKAGKELFPPGDEVFAALNTTAFEDVRVVILGQDPYHGPGQAHGLSFSVRPGVRVPPSLRNIYKELLQDLNCPIAAHGYLKQWAQQGVLLINSVLTVESGLAGSHQGKGWERFSDAIVDRLNRHREGLVFLLWGNYARKKGSNIDRQKHLVLSSPHPSPLSASRGFFGNHHFSKTNEYLSERGEPQINWQLNELN